ncbi:MAG: FprA family A-type flavoprotein [Bacteroidales bacterium]|nr:FprA family A-type flavoprotein [Bacteroidales bacterium]
MKLTERIRYVGVNDRQTVLFENQWPIPEGVSYNAYLVVDEKVALIDTAAAAFGEAFLEKIRQEIGDRPVDYLVVNHMEPDHSALQSRIRAQYPDITIVTNAKAVPMIAGFQGITENIQVIREGESLPLGETTLQFFMAPMVHWPETMVTWCPEEQTLFSGDAFGTFKAVNSDVIDCKSNDYNDFKEEMTRYYASIVGKYGATVQNALKKLAALPVKRICSTHGPVWERDIPQVVALYDRLSRYEADPGVVIAYGSMYGNTAKAAQALAAALESAKIPHAVHDLCSENVSYALRDVFRYETLALGAPTYNNGIFPPARQLMEAVCDRLVRNRRFFAFGSFTWAGASVRLLNEMAKSAGMELIGDGISFQHAYSPDKCDFTDLLHNLTRC